MAATWFRALWSVSTSGAQVRGYRLLKEVGSGGFSTVFAAEDLEARRRVALKLARTRGREVQQKFDAEAEIGERLASARGIVGTLARSRTRDGRPVLVMPYYDLGNAADLLAEGQRLPLTDVVDLVQEVAQGLDAMHRQHYLHRDISPRNVLRSTELGSALGDLGCARAFNSTTEPPWTQALTPGYAAPETVAAVAVQTIASDVYGLAATAWALFTGAPPYGRPPDPMALELVARYELLRNSQPPATAPLLAAGLPSAAAKVLTQALDPDPGRRPGRVMDLSDALASALRSGAAASHETRAETEAEPVTAVDRPAVDSNLPGPIRPSSVRASDIVDATELSDAGAASDRARTATGGRAGWTGRPAVSQRWRILVAVLVCFVLSFTVVRALSGSTPPSDPVASPTPSPTVSGSGRPGPLPSASEAALKPDDYGKVAPRDLELVALDEDSVILRWTPPTDPNALVLLYRSVTKGDWRRVDVDLQGANGRTQVPVNWSGGRYCFMLVVVVGSSRGFTSNSICLNEIES